MRNSVSLLKQNRKPKLPCLKRNKSIFTALKGITCALIAGIVLGGCLGEDQPDPNPTPIALMTVYHGAPGTAGLDIYVSDKQVNNSTFNYDDYSGYGNFYSGDCHLTFKPGGGATVLARRHIRADNPTTTTHFL